MNLRFGIIGYGFMGHEHMTLLSDFDGIDVIAICDREADQMNDAPKELQNTRMQQIFWQEMISMLLSFLQTITSI